VVQEVLITPIVVLEAEQQHHLELPPQYLILDLQLILWLLVMLLEAPLMLLT
jgi:hypothetical protein